MKLLVLVTFLSLFVTAVKSGIFYGNLTETLMVCAMCEGADRFVIDCEPDGHFVTHQILAMSMLRDRCSSKHNCSDGTIPNCCRLQQGDICAAVNEYAFNIHLSCLYTSRCVLRLNSSLQYDELLCGNQKINAQFYMVEYICAKDEHHMRMTSNQMITGRSAYLVTENFPELAELRQEDWVCSAEAVCGDQIELYRIEHYFMEYGLCPTEMRVEEDGETTTVLTCSVNAIDVVKTQLIFTSKRNFVRLRLTKTRSSVTVANIVFYIALSAVNGNISVRCGSESLTSKLVKCSDDPVITTECADCPSQEETQLDMFTIILILFGTVIVIVIIAVAAIFVNQSMKRKKRRGKRIRVKPTTQSNLRTLKALPEITKPSSTKQPLPRSRKLDPVLIDTRLRNAKSTGLTDGDLLIDDPLNPKGMGYSYANHGRGDLAAVEGDVLQ